MNKHWNATWVVIIHIVISKYPLQPFYNDFFFEKQVDKSGIKELCVHVFLNSIRSLYIKKLKMNDKQKKE